MYTISKLAQQFNLSRTTLLYYEREGLLTPTTRSENGYRWYGDKAVAQLELIVAYRNYGLPISKIKTLLASNKQTQQPALLREHFHHLAQEIEQLKAQQKAIVTLLQEPELLTDEQMTKERWVEIMRMSDFDDDAMINWHKKFETMEPEKHQQFLLSLGIDEREISRIRAF